MSNKTIIFFALVMVTSCTPAPTATPTFAPPTATLPQPTLAQPISTRQATITPSAAPSLSSTATRRATATKVNTSRGPYDEDANAKYDVSWALAMAKADRKNVLLDFGANWCLDCVVLSKIFDDPAVSPFLDANFYVIKIDVGKWDKNLDISQQYGKPIDKGIPAVVVLDPDGHIVATTKNGELADARYSNKQQILDLLRQWAPRKP